MSERRISGSQRKSNRAGTQYHSSVKSAKTPKELLFMGVSLSGGKNDKTTITELSFFPQHGKLFVKEVHDKIETKDSKSGDSILIEILNKKKTQFIGIDAPLSLPHCLVHSCKEVSQCRSPSIKWLWNHYKKHKQKKKNLKLFTPYTERCVERYVNYDLEDFFEMPEALGANKAPITARSIYLKGKIKGRLLEVFPKLSLYRMGVSLRISKLDLKNYRHAANGAECRYLILDTLISSGILFVYQQDVQKYIDSVNAFDSLICALSVYLEYRGQAEAPPTGYPSKEAWISFPKLMMTF